MIEYMFKNRKKPAKRDVVNRLNRAADLVESGRWTAGRFHHDDAQCVLGFLAKAGRSTATYNACAMALATQLHSEGKIPQVHEFEIASWNDAQRDKRKIVRALRRTARNVAADKISYWCY